MNDQTHLADIKDKVVSLREELMAHCQKIEGVMREELINDPNFVLMLLHRTVLLQFSLASQLLELTYAIGKLND